MTQPQIEAKAMELYPLPIDGNLNYDGYSKQRAAYIKGYTDAVAGWISVAESPKESGQYLVVYTGPHKTEVTIAYYYSSDGWDRYKNNDYQVTHWQPIPSPPKIQK